MNTSLIALVVAVLVGAGAYLLLAPRAEAPQQSGHTTEEHSESSESHSDAGMDMDEHKRLMNDGETFMAMSNEISPAVLYARPGQDLTFASHEPFPVQLKTVDGKYSTLLAQPGDPHSIFKAPMTPGRYEFVSSHDASVKAAVIVEQ